MFTLLGEPPFTFTYQRSEPIPKKGGKPGRVLESHTVSRVYSNEYTIYSALEGNFLCLYFVSEVLKVFRNLDSDVDIRWLLSISYWTPRPKSR